MIIKSIYINRFGCHENLQIDFNAGVNTIFMPNEGGKSTIAEFIRVMLFGVDSLRFNQRKKYMPFGCTAISGELTLEVDGREYIIRRTFGAKKSDDITQVFDGVGGGILKEYCVDNVGQLFGGVNGDTFENVCYIKQLSPSVDIGKATEIQTRLLNLCQSGNEDFSYRNAIGILDTAIKDLNGNRGKIKEIQGRLNEIALKRAEKGKLLNEYNRAVADLEGAKQGENKKCLWHILLWLPAVFSGVLTIISRFNPVALGTFLLLAVLSVFALIKHRDGNRLKQARIVGSLESKAEYLKKQYTEIDVSDESALKLKLDEYNLALGDLFEAKAALTRAFEKLQSDYSPRLNALAGGILKRITGGKYVGFMADENFGISLRDNKNQLVTDRYLSSGTYYQVYFALRMALAKLVCENMPMIFDDAFALYDHKRLEKALEFLAAENRQVIIFSCHERESQLLPSGFKVKPVANTHIYSANT